MKRIILSILIVFAVSVVSWGQSKEEKEVAAAVEQLRVAMVSGDRAVLEKLTAKELTYGHSSGLVEDQKAFVEALATGKSDFLTIDLQEQTIRMVGSTALVRHNLIGETNSGGKRGAVKAGVMMVWQKKQGEWKLLARQAFKL